MWNGFSMISKRPELTDGMMETLDEAERTLIDTPGKTALDCQQLRPQLVGGRISDFFFFTLCVSSQRVFSRRPLCDPTAEGSVSEEPRPDRGGGGLLPECVFHVSSARSFQCVGVMTAPSLGWAVGIG